MVCEPENKNEVRGKLHGLCFNKEFSMEMLEQWVAATGPFAFFPWGQPLSSTLGSLERYHYDSTTPGGYVLCVSASCEVTAAAGLRGTASPLLTSWPGRCWTTCTVLHCTVLPALYCRCWTTTACWCRGVWSLTRCCRGR